MNKINQKTSKIKYDELTPEHDEIIKSTIELYLKPLEMNNKEDPFNIQKIIMEKGYYEAFRILEANSVIRYN